MKNNNLADYLKHYSDQSKLKKYLKSSFVYSLPEQNLTAAGNPGNRQRLDSWCNEDMNFVAIPILSWIEYDAYVVLVESYSSVFIDLVDIYYMCEQLTG